MPSACDTGYRRRTATAEAILALSGQGMPIKRIARTTGHSRKLVRNVLRGSTGDVFRTRSGSLDAYLRKLDSEWTADCRNGAELWRRLRAKGSPAAFAWSANERHAVVAANRLQTERLVRYPRRPSSRG